MIAFDFQDLIRMVLILAVVLFVLHLFVNAFSNKVSDPVKELLTGKLKKKTTTVPENNVSGDVVEKQMDDESQESTMEDTVVLPQNEILEPTLKPMEGDPIMGLKMKHQIDGLLDQDMGVPALQESDFVLEEQNKDVAMGYDNRVSNRPYIKDATQQPAYFMPGESLACNTNDEHKSATKYFEAGNADSKELLNQYADFRRVTNESSHNIGEDPVDKINRLYRTQDNRDSKFFPGMKIKDVFNMMTSSNINQDRCFVIPGNSEFKQV